MEMTKEAVFNSIENMTVMQVLALTKDLEVKWGLKAEPPPQQIMEFKPIELVAVQTEFSVILTSMAIDKKISLIKAVREMLGLPLKEAKELIENLPKMIKEGLSMSDAEMYKERLVEAGGKVEIK
jgi:large subunit ribosomal protein L7/L12